MSIKSVSFISKNQLKTKVGIRYNKETILLEKGGKG